MEVDDAKNANSNDAAAAADNKTNNTSSSLPLIPITLLQTTLELSLLQSANLLPNPPPTAVKPKNKRQVLMKKGTATKVAGGTTASAASAAAAVAEADTPKSHLQKKLKKLNTDMYYRQHKFNLLAEESEGYAKLWECFMSGIGGSGGGSGDVDGLQNGKVAGDAGGGGGDAGGGGNSSADGDDAVDVQENNNNNNNKYIRELIGAFDLDPNRVLDLALDALEWELNELVMVAHGGGGVNGSVVGGGGGSKSSSFAELSKLGKKNAEDGAWWGLETVRGALSNVGGSGGNGAQKKKKVVHSLLSIIRELDGNTNNNNEGSEYYHGRGAVAHLLGFKYRSYHARHVASVAAATAASSAGNNKQGTTTGKDNATTNNANGTVGSGASRNNIYPRSLHLSTAFLCAHHLLDVHALIPHLMASANSTATTKAVSNKGAGGSATVTTATPLMQVYQTHCTETITRLKKLGVVSLNSSKAADNKKDEANNSKSSGNESKGGESLSTDPIIGIFRALLAVVGDWDTSVGFLAHASVSEFASLVNKSSDSGGDMEDEHVDKLKSAMDSAVLAACTLNQSMASDVCAWVGNMVDGVYREMYPSSSSNNGNSARVLNQQKVGQSLSMMLLLPSSSTTTGGMLTKDSTLEEMSSILNAPLSALVKSGKICLNQNLYIKMCRLYKHKLQSSSPTNDSSEINGPSSTTPSSVIIDNNTLSVLSTFLVPSLSLFPSDTILPSELWAVLKNLPYPIRYKLYAAWRHPGLEKGTLRALLPSAVRAGQVPKPLDVIESEIKTGIAARYVLKRISKENIKDMGRQLAKVSHNNPLVVFTDILGKIESYDNLILMMVDTFEFVTELGLDVMGYCLLVSLGGGENMEVGGTRSRTKMGGLNTEQWLASLETFTGAFYKKFPDVELRGILAYITKRFKEGQASELGVLRSLIKTVGGYGFVDYDSTAALSDLQLDGRCGSRMLKRETSSFGVVDDINRKASRSSDRCYREIRSRVLYSKSAMMKEHVKVIGNMYDDCEAVLFLLLEYLSDSSDDSNAKAKFAASMPSLTDLHEKYGVDTASAWMLCRPLVRKSMFYMDDSKLANKTSPGEPPAYLKDFTLSPEMTGSYKSLLPEAAWKHITKNMFEMFYSLAIYDISCPEERYNVDIDRLKKECERLTQLQKGGVAARGQMSALAAAAAAAGGNYDQIRQATAFTKTHAMELDRLKRNVDQLSNDFQRQQKRCKLVLSKLESQKESLIGPGKDEVANNAMFAPAFMTFCIYPRCFLSPEDSLFCAHFVKLLHKIKVPGFLTIELIDNIVNAVIGSLYCMTEDEAGNCSIFLNEIWKSVNSWRYDNDAFASELKNTPGAQLSKEFAQENGYEDHSLTGGITHDDYKAIYSQWHQKIGNAAIGCLKSSEYMHTRAALIVLSRIVLVFPTQPKTGDKILKTLGPLQSDDNERPDIRATAQGYCSQLMKARDEGMWKEENIAVTKARQEREKMKAEERKKKLAKQHEDMKKESEMISGQLGDGRDSWRPDRRDGGRPWGVDPRMQSRGQPLNVGASTFTPKPTFTPKSGEIRELHGRPADTRRPGVERDVWERDRGRQPDSRRQSGERRKRSRSPEPGEDTERPTQKRSRGDRDWPPHRRDQSSSDQQPSSRGGARRSDRRGGGSSRY
ncbi:hypothetical protein ACHAXR_008594 [Thalassiosira sp. AJA248-18]